MKKDTSKNGGFRVGMEVIAIRTHSEGEFKKGERFIIQGIKKGCKCVGWLLDIGYTGAGTYCNSCKMNYGNNISWFGAYSFRPITDADNKPEMSNVTSEDIIKEMGLLTVGINN